MLVLELVGIVGTSCKSRSRSSSNNSGSSSSNNIVTAAAVGVGRSGSLSRSRLAPNSCNRRAAAPSKTP